VELALPEGTQSGKVLRLKGRGLPPLQPRLDPARLEKMRGDIFVRIFVEVPTRLTVRQRELLEEFAEESGQNVSPEHKSFVEKLKDFFD
jgi:molecular chaperone DnaJ